MKIQYKDGQIQMNLTVKEYELVMRMMNQFDCTDEPEIYKMLIRMRNFIGKENH